MKRLLLPLLLLLLSPTIRAEDPPPVDPNTPLSLTRIVDGFHLLDNGTVATFYDALHGIPLAGSITTPYKRWYCSLDVGLGYPMTQKGKAEISTAAEFIGGVRLHAGEFLYDQFPQVRELVDASPIRKGALQYTAVGVFYSRDWTAGDNRIGPYGGFELSF